MRTLSTRARAGIAGCALALLTAGLVPGTAQAQESGLSAIGLVGGGTRLASFSTAGPGGAAFLPPSPA